MGLAAGGGRPPPSSDGEEVLAIDEAELPGRRADPVPRALLPDRAQMQRATDVPSLIDPDHRRAVDALTDLAPADLDERGDALPVVLTRRD